MSEDIPCKDPRDELLNRCKSIIRRLESELDEEIAARKNAEELFAEAVGKIQEMSSYNSELSHIIENSRAQVRSLERQLNKLTAHDELKAKAEVFQKENSYLVKKLKEKDQFILELRRQVADVSFGEVLSKENKELRDTVFELSEKLHQKEKEIESLVKRNNQLGTPPKREIKMRSDLLDDLRFDDRMSSINTKDNHDEPMLKTERSSYNRSYLLNHKF